MEKCKKCENIVQPAKEGVKCTDCFASFHLLCVSSTGKVSTRKGNWKCEGCAAESMSTSSRVSGKDSDAAQSVVLEAIAAFRKEFNDRSDETATKLNILQDDIKSVVSEVEVLKLDVAEIKTKQENTANSVDSLKQQQLEMKRELFSLQREIDSLQQHSRKNNILISGVPLTTGENVYAVLDRLANLLGVSNHRYNVSAAHRLPIGNQNDSRPPSIIVSFVSRAVKHEWLYARLQRRSLSARELEQSFPDVQVYINEHLTKHTREIFNGARSLVKAKKLAAAWTSDGRVLVKRGPTAHPFRVVDM